MQLFCTADLYNRLIVYKNIFTKIIIKVFCTIRYSNELMEYTEIAATHH